MLGEALPVVDTVIVEGVADATPEELLEVSSSLLLLLELGAAAVVVVALVRPVALVMVVELRIVEDGIPELLLAVALGAKEELVLKMEVVGYADDDATLLLAENEEVA